MTRRSERLKRRSQSSGKGRDPRSGVGQILVAQEGQVVPKPRLVRDLFEPVGEHRRRNHVIIKSTVYRLIHNTSGREETTRERDFLTRKAKTAKRCCWKMKKRPKAATLL